jgi:glycosyltransferase involved in cell wall biosynthesis
VAAELRDVAFDVVGVVRDGSPRVSPLLDRAARLPNVTIHGVVPYAKMADYYRRCQVLCCTSAHEGFPNTFLEAWTLGIPVVSTFDPDGVIATHDLGSVARDQKELVDCLRRITRSPEVWREYSIRARKYCLENHAPDVCLPQLERVLQDAATL